MTVKDVRESVAILGDLANLHCDQNTLLPRSPPPTPRRTTIPSNSSKFNHRSHNIPASANDTNHNQRVSSHSANASVIGLNDNLSINNPSCLTTVSSSTASPEDSLVNSKLPSRSPKSCITTPPTEICVKKHSAEEQSKEELRKDYDKLQKQKDNLERELRIIRCKARQFNLKERVYMVQIRKLTKENDKLREKLEKMIEKQAMSSSSKEEEGERARRLASIDNDSKEEDEDEKEEEKKDGERKNDMALSSSIHGKETLKLKSLMQIASEKNVPNSKKKGNEIISTSTQQSNNGPFTQMCKLGQRLVHHVPLQQVPREETATKKSVEQESIHLSNIEVVGTVPPQPEEETNEEQLLYEDNRYSSFVTINVSKRSTDTTLSHVEQSDDEWKRSKTEEEGSKSRKEVSQTGLLERFTHQDHEEEDQTYFDEESNPQEQSRGPFRGIRRLGKRWMQQHRDRVAKERLHLKQPPTDEQHDAEKVETTENDKEAEEVATSVSVTRESNDDTEERSDHERDVVTKSSVLESGDEDKNGSKSKSSQNPMTEENEKEELNEVTPSSPISATDENINNGNYLGDKFIDTLTSQHPNDGPVKEAELQTSTPDYNFPEIDRKQEEIIERYCQQLNASTSAVNDVNLSTNEYDLSSFVDNTCRHGEERRNGIQEHDRSFKCLEREEGGSSGRNDLSRQVRRETASTKQFCLEEYAYSSDGAGDVGDGGNVYENVGHSREFADQVSPTPNKRYNDNDVCESDDHDPKTLREFEHRVYRQADVPSSNFIDWTHPNDDGNDPITNHTTNRDDNADASSMQHPNETNEHSRRSGSKQEELSHRSEEKIASVVGHYHIDFCGSSDEEENDEDDSSEESDGDVEKLRKYALQSQEEIPESIFIIPHHETDQDEQTGLSSTNASSTAQHSNGPFRGVKRLGQRLIHPHRNCGDVEEQSNHSGSVDDMSSQHLNWPFQGVRRLGQKLIQPHKFSQRDESVSTIINQNNPNERNSKTARAG